MNEEKRKDAEAKTSSAADADQKGGGLGGSGSRARNRTVMLTPEMTGQVRALLNTDEPSATPQRRDPLADLLPPSGSDYVRPGGGLRASSESARISDLASEESDRPPTGRMRGSAGGRGAAPSAANPSFSMGAASGSFATHSAPRSAGPVGQVVMGKAAKSKIIGFFVSFDRDNNGEVYEIRSGRWLLTSRATDHSDFILIEDESISPLHAIVRATNDGKIQILDQLSEFGTAVFTKGGTEEQDITGSMTSVSHGDRIRFGKRMFVVCLVPKGADSSGAGAEEGRSA